MKNKLKENFRHVFKRDCENVYFSPGRVNLIGEHIDYNGGNVLPCAISIGTYGAVLLRNDNLVRIYSKGFSNNIYEFYLNDIKKDKNNSWADYIKGVFDVLIKNNHNIPFGIDIYLESSLPTNAGLSSSASLELLIIFILNDLFKFNLTFLKMAEYGKIVENDFIGVNSGIMDQFAIAGGAKNKAILLNSQNLSYKYIPLEFKNFELVIVNTNKKRSLADSKYNERFSQCLESLTILKNHGYNIDNLCFLTSFMLDEIKDKLSPLLFKRVSHVVSENERSQKAASLLINNDIHGFCQLLIKSHNSLKNNYEVTGVELDSLVEFSLKYKALGARMTGAGFGGCMILFVDKKDKDFLIENVKRDYFAKIGYYPSFYNVDFSNGPEKLN